MASINREMQERVWQRVRGQAEPMQADPGEPGVQALLLGELTDAALLRKAGGDALNTLARQATERADILRGICILTQTDAPGKLPPAKEPGPAVLRLLMGSLLRRQKEYCRLQEQPEFGAIYSHLAQSAQNSCALLAKYIGTTPLRNGRK